MWELVDFLTFGVGIGAAAFLIIVVAYSIKHVAPYVRKITGRDKSTSNDDLLARLDQLEAISMSISSKEDQLKEDVRKTKSKIEILYDWHNVSDEDGLKVWYVKKSLENTIVKLSDAIIQLSASLREVVLIQQQIKQDIEKIRQEIADVENAVIRLGK